MLAGQLDQIVSRNHTRDRNKTTILKAISLAIVDEIVHLHQGTIPVSSMPGEGSCFTVRFPSANV